MAYVETWDETKPAGSREANIGDDDIREYKRAMRERLAGGGMYFPSTDDSNAGLYQYVKFIEQSSNPTSEANRGFLFCKDVSAVTELYWMDSAGTVTQLTSGGKILISSLIIGSEAQGDIIYRAASAWARLGAGTSGQFLKTQGAAANPVWAAAAFQTAATQAEMEAASVTNAPVTPGRFQYHPGAAKAWVLFDGTGASPITKLAGHNISGTISKTSTGIYVVTMTTAFSSANYVVKASGGGASDPAIVSCIARTTTTFTLKSVNSEGNVIDAAFVDAVAFGDQ